MIAQNRKYVHAQREQHTAWAIVPQPNNSDGVGEMFFEILQAADDKTLHLYIVTKPVVVSAACSSSCSTKKSCLKRTNSRAKEHFLVFAEPVLHPIHARQDPGDGNQRNDRFGKPKLTSRMICTSHSLSVLRFNDAESVCDIAGQFRDDQYRIRFLWCASTETTTIARNVS